MRIARTRPLLTTLCISVILAAVTASIYAPVRHHGFIDFDDPDYILENRHVRTGLTTDNAWWAFTNAHASNWHPLTWLSHMIDCQLWGLNPGMHHLVNLVIHAINVVLVFLVFQQMTGATWASAFVAALFGWHPLHVESVAWISERKDVLSTFFWFLTLWAYVWYVRRPGVLRYILVTVFLALGLMAKPMLVTLPFVLLLVDYWPLRRQAAITDGVPMRSWPGLVLEKIPLFVLVAASCIVTFIVQRQSGAVKAFEVLPLQARLPNALIAYVTYLLKGFWPADLSILYPLPRAFPWWEAVSAATVLIAISVVAIIQRKHNPWLPVGWFWYLGTLVPVIGIVQVGDQFIADRYTYVPAIGIFVILAFGAQSMALSLPFGRPLVFTGGALILAGCLATTAMQVSYWKSSVTLFTRSLQVAQTPSLHNNLGVVLEREGKWNQAVTHYREALRLNPAHPDAYNNLGVVLIKQERLKEAISYLRRAVRLTPGFAKAHNNLGKALQDLGRVDEAIGSYQKAVQLRPDFAEALNNLGTAFEKKGRLDEAVAAYQEALRFKPDYAFAHNNIGCAFQQQGHLSQAILSYREALRLDPNYPEAHANLGGALLIEHQIPEAIEHLSDALRLKPKFVVALEKLGWIHASSSVDAHRNAQEAISIAERTVTLKGNKDARALDLLAAAQAEAGRFDEASNTATRARDLAALSGSSQFANEVQERIRLYEQQRPFRQDF